MLEVFRKKFSAIEFLNVDNQGDNQVVKIEEGMVIEVVLEESGEVLVGTVTKIANKEIFIHVVDEDWDRVFTHDALVDIRPYIEDDE